MDNITQEDKFRLSNKLFDAEFKFNFWIILLSDMEIQYVEVKAWLFGNILRNLWGEKKQYILEKVVEPSHCPSENHWCEGLDHSQRSCLCAAFCILQVASLHMLMEQIGSSPESQLSNQV